MDWSAAENVVERYIEWDVIKIGGRESIWLNVLNNKEEEDAEDDDVMCLCLDVLFFVGIEKKGAKVGWCIKHGIR